MNVKKENCLFFLGWIIEDTKDVGKIETPPKFEGKQMIMVVQPA